MTAIKDPVLYLKDTRPGQSIKRIRSVCIDGSRVPAYVIQELNGCGVCGAACLAAFASGGTSSFDTSLEHCLDVAKNGFTRTVNGTTDYYTRLGKEAPFVRKCLNAVSSGLTARSSLFAKRRAVKEILSGRPVLLNIGFSGQYRDHTVTAYGLEEYVVGPLGKRSLFFKVRDGYSKEDRYLLYRGILGISVTYLKPKA
ncbi:MAG: hypothetical protein II185_03220 [Firmicutes bacterium]|nr:hypothetical protein [Bacillota bacterium]MBQ3930865.1 hypothetical protein [Bacillota bacterium]